MKLMREGKFWVNFDNSPKTHSLLTAAFDCMCLLCPPPPPPPPPPRQRHLPSPMKLYIAISYVGKYSSVCNLCRCTNFITSIVTMVTYDKVVKKMLAINISLSMSWRSTFRVFPLQALPVSAAFGFSSVRKFVTLFFKPSVNHKGIAS